MSSEEQPKRTAEPVGQQLRRAREKLGLDLSAIADQQHLRTSVIQAIEDGDYSKVDTELFLKGYVRAYARQVELDADAVIRDLDAELEPLRKERERQHEADPLVDIQRRKRRKRRIARAVGVIVVLAAVGFGVITWLADSGRGLPGFSASAPADNSDDQPSAPADEPVVTEPVDESGDDPVTEDPAPEPGLQPEVTEEASVIEDDPSEPSAQPEPETPGVEAQASPEPDALVTEPPAQSQSPAEPVVEETSVVTAAPVSEEPVSSGVTLRMSFSNDCWVQVTDADGNRLASTLRSEGDVLEVEGAAPLDVIVGAMSAVASMELQGQPMDLGSFRVVNDRAQFTLEP